MSESSGEQFGGVLVAFGAALAAALAAAALITVIHRPPGGLVATLSGPGGQATCSAAFSPDGTMVAVTEHGHTYLWRPPRPRLASGQRSPSAPSTAATTPWTPGYAPGTPSPPATGARGSHSALPDR